MTPQQQRATIAGSVVLAFIVMAATSAFAQGSIAGVVKDPTGAVLPGVTVEASSPVLIEQVRVVTTDGEGLYKIVDLRPGAYVVSFSLPGFSTVKREGIELTGGFNATVNAEMPPGALEETITVSGVTPMVDTQNVVTERTLQREVIDAVPTGSRSFGNLGVLIPGVTVPVSDGQDVGGTTGYNVRMTIHNSRTSDTQLLMDGMSYSAGGTTSGRTGLHVNDGMVQEVSLELGGMSAESALGGVVTNQIPKEGGNTLRGVFFAAYSDHHLQSDNLTDALIARGLGATNALKKTWDLNPAVGGALRKDRLWFFSSLRYWGTNNTLAGIYYNLTPNSFVYTPDLNHQADTNLWLGSENLRLTWQASPRNKINLYYEDQQMVQDHYSGTSNSPEATLSTLWTPNYIAQTAWNSTVTSRLLLQAGITAVIFDFPGSPQPGVPRSTQAITEQSTGFGWRASPGNFQQHNLGHQYNSRASASYISGSHAIKVGMQFSNGWSLFSQDHDGGGGTTLTVLLPAGTTVTPSTVLQGTPSRVTQYATPLDFRESLKANLGIYALDQWRVKRLALNIGVRFDYINVYVPAQHEAAGPFVKARDFAQVNDVPNWKDISPRVGVAYDLFGSGKTVLKGSLSRYLGGFSVTDFTRQANPAQAAVTTAFRTWNDVNENKIPDRDLTNFDPNGECQGLSNRNLGGSIPTSRYDPSVTTGWGSRPYNWEISGGIGHELSSNVSLEASYFRRSYGNKTITDNLAVTPADYDPFCINVPADSRLPGGGGNRLCGLYDINLTKFNQVDNLITIDKRLREVYDGVDLNTNIRIPGGVRLAGGLSAGRTTVDSCFVVDSPQALLFCKVTPPFQPQYKFTVVYPLPWGFQTSGSIQSVLGPQSGRDAPAVGGITASYVARNTEIIGLGRNLSTGATGTVTVPLVQAGTIYGDRMNQVDYRVTKIFKVGRRSVRANFDIFNIFNVSPVLALNNAYGPSWQKPTTILQGRLVKFGAQVEF